MALVLTFAAGTAFGSILAIVLMAALFVSRETEISSGVEIVETGPPTLRPVAGDGMAPGGELVEDWFDRMEEKAKAAHPSRTLHAVDTE